MLFCFRLTMYAHTVNCISCALNFETRHMCAMVSPLLHMFVSKWGIWISTLSDRLLLVIIHWVPLAASTIRRNTKLTMNRFFCAKIIASGTRCIFSFFIVVIQIGIPQLHIFHHLWGGFSFTYSLTFLWPLLLQSMSKWFLKLSKERLACTLYIIQFNV